MIYEGLFSSKESVLEEFCITEAELQGAEIIYATYDFESYEGSAWVLLKRDKDYFEVVSGHCSCNGLEGSWRMEPTSKKAILMRPDLNDRMRKLVALLPDNRELSSIDLKRIFLLL